MFKLNLFPSQYTSISSKDPHMGSADYNHMFVGTDENGFIYRSLLKFKIDELPINIFVINAKLSLFSEDLKTISCDNFTPYLITSDWKKETVTWNMLPTVDLSKGCSVLESVDKSKCEWDITRIVRNWIDNKESNYGLLLKSKEDGSHDLCRFLTQGYDKKPCLKLSLYCYEKTELASREVYCITNEYIANKKPKFTDWIEVSKYSMYTFFVKNLGTSSVIIQVQISPDKESVFNESVLYRIPKKGTTAITPMLYTFYNRLVYRTVPPGNQSDIKVWFQAQV